jgi:hypothetical protein
MSEFTVGQTVVCPKGIYEPADDCSPAGWLCDRGAVLVVREVREAGQWPISVSHPEITDGSFSVAADEIKSIGKATP